MSDTDGLIARTAGDDVIVPVRMRRASFLALSSTPDGRSVAVDAGSIGLVPDCSDEHGNDVWTFVISSKNAFWSAAGEYIPGNQASFQALMEQEADARDRARDAAELAYDAAWDDGEE